MRSLVPTGTFTPLLPARNFAFRVAVWSVCLFGLLRLPSVEASVLLPVTQLQGRLAMRLFGTPALPIEVTLACSGADAIALCAGFILGYPARWRSRIAAVAGGLTMILTLNTLRIGTLGRVSSPAAFDTLHLYVWPALLVLAIAGYVLSWMQRVDMSCAPTRPTGPPLRTRTITPSFVVLAGGLLVLFTAAAPLYLENRGILLIAGLMAQAAAEVLSLMGMEATASANVLYTGRGGFLVTQECISTPLIPIYLAGVLAYGGSRARRGGLLLAAVPLFAALGVARLLVVALPATLIQSPLILVHAFYQLLLGAVIVCLAALWRHGPGPKATRRAVAGVGAGAICLLLWPYGTPVLASAFPSASSTGDPQGVMTLLPAFQVALFAALCVGIFVRSQWRLCAAGLTGLALSLLAGYAMLDSLQTHANFVPHVRELRAWAVGMPLLLVIAMVRYEHPRR